MRTQRTLSSLATLNVWVGKTAPLTCDVNQSSKLEYTNPLQKSLM